MKILLLLLTSYFFVASLLGLQTQQPTGTAPQRKASTPRTAHPAGKKPAGPLQPSSYDGTWNGKSSQDKTLQFRVEKGRITSISFGARLAGIGCSSDSSTTTNVNEPIVGSTFSVGAQANPVVIFEGKFASPSVAQGKAGMFLNPVAGPPGALSCSGAARVTWTAWKGDTPPDEATLARLTAPPKRLGSSLVKLISPAAGEVIDNGCYNLKEPRVWDFRWSEVPRAQQYHLYVTLDFEANPTVDRPGIRGTSFADTSSGYIRGEDLEGWHWKVRPMIGGVWKDWSEERVFRVESPNEDCNQWRSQFLKAVADGNTERLKELTSLEWADVKRSSLSALVTAAESGHTEVAKMLIAAGADVNVGGDPDQPTPLMVAARGGRPDFVQVLLEAGADVNKDEFGHHETALYCAARNGHTEIVKLLLQRGANPDGGTWGKMLRAPLIAAVENGHTDVVQALVAAGADPSVGTWVDAGERREYRDARALARQKGNVEVIRLLEDANKRRQ